MMKKIFALLTALLLLLCLPFAALADEEEDDALYTDYIFDFAFLMDDAEVLELESRAAEISETWDCGVYLLTVDDMTDYGYSNIEAFAEYVYDELELGLGEERDGVLLVMSMEERDFDVAAHGGWGNYAFAGYGAGILQDNFLPSFRNNDWYGGFKAYVDTCEYVLGDARAYADEHGGIILTDDEYGYESNNYVPADDRSFAEKCADNAPFGGIIGLIVGAIRVLTQKGKMNTVKKAANADRYVAHGGVNMQIVQDLYTHTTRVVQQINTDSGSRGGGGYGGGHISSGGFSHSSGKF